MSINKFSASPRDVQIGGKMANPDDVESIITGAFALLGLIGLPVAAVVVPVVQIVRGVLGLKNNKGE